MYINSNLHQLTYELDLNMQEERCLKKKIVVSLKRNNWGTAGIWTQDLLFTRQAL